MNQVCKNLESCEFFKVYQSHPDKELALRGLARMYCKGDRQQECKRMRVSQVLGGEFVPTNMMPNGYPLVGTSRDDWDPQIIDCLSNKNCAG